MPTRLLLAMLWLCAVLLPASAAAQSPRAWLDRDRIAFGETVTLNIETTQGEPDYAPLQRDFNTSGHTSRRSFELANGRATTRSLYAVALRPRRSGNLEVPALRVGPAMTRPLALNVAAAPSPLPARVGDDVFIESVADDDDPYVQQSVGWIVRLYSRAPLVSGQLDQPEPDGASLQKVGDDAQYARDLGGQRYYVIERRFQLVPERSGTLTIPGATFSGRGAGGFFDEMFGDRGAALAASARPRFLQVRPVPANAPQPWLPLRSLTLRYIAQPASLRQGAAATLTVEAVADGAHAAQLPELRIDGIDGLQVFAEPAQFDDALRGGRPRTRLVRQFALVPSRAGELRLPALRVGWWDVERGEARMAELPPLRWEVAAAPAGSASASPATAMDVSGPLSQRVAAATGGANRGWVLATAAFAALWLLTLLWGVHRRGHGLSRDDATPARKRDAPPPPAAAPADLRRWIDRADLGDIAAALPAMAQPPVADLDAVIARLDDPDQREAVAALQRARWGGGDGVEARDRLRRAFAKGPRWILPPTRDASPLSPLYPPAS